MRTLTGGERGFLLLTSCLGDPARKPLTAAQFRELTHRAKLMTDDDGSIIIMDDKDLTMFVNLLNEDYYKDINDIITIRGKGKFIYDGIEKETRSGRYLINLRKYK